MATPQVSVSTSVNESTKTIYYTISYSADYDPEPNESNYNNGAEGYMYLNKEADGSKSYQTEYDNGLSSKTITIQYTYNRRYIEKTRTHIGLFNSEAEALNYVNGQTYPGSYSIEVGPAGYAVYQIYVVKTDPTYRTGTASATAYFTPKPQTPSEAAHTIKAGSDYVMVRFYNYLSTDKLTVEINGTTASRYGNGSVTVGGLEPGTGYVGRIYANDIEIEVFAITTTGSATSSDPYIFNSGMSDNTGTEMFVVVYRTKSTYTASITVNGVDKGLYGCNDNSTIYRLPSEPYSVYTVEIVINGITLTTTINTTPNIGTFQWTTNIYQGAKMNSWQNSTNGATHPAPVTAEEWNRLVTLVNAKRSTSIPTVAQGERMYAGPGSKIRQVADILDVAVDNGNRITAQFFLELQDAINNM